MLHKHLLTAALALTGLGLFAAPADAEIKVRGARAQPAPQRAAAVRLSNNRAPATATSSYSSNGYGTSTKHSGYGNSYGGYGQSTGGYASGGYSTGGYNTGGGVHVGYNSGGFGIGVSFGSCAPARHWVPGSWQHNSERYWVPERHERIWRDAVYETRYDSCGRAYTVCVQSAGWGSLTYPGYWDNRTARVWVAGHYASY